MLLIWQRRQTQLRNLLVTNLVYVCGRAQRPIREEFVPFLRNMKCLRGRDASPLSGYPPGFNSPVLIYTSGWNEAPWDKGVLPKNTTWWARTVVIEPFDHGALFKPNG